MRWVKDTGKEQQEVSKITRETEGGVGASESNVKVTKIKSSSNKK